MSAGGDRTKRGEFYHLRDRRTETYLERPWHPSTKVRVVIDSASASSEVGQHLLMSLTNLLSRVHRHIIFTLPKTPIPLRTFSVRPSDTVQKATLELARAIDPFGYFEHADTGGDLTLGIGPDAGQGLDWYLGADRAIGYLQRRPTVLETNMRGSMRGAGLAACLGAAAAFKAELGLPVVQRMVSAWNYKEGEAAETGPDDLSALNIGRVLLVGAGAVGSGLVYWLRSWGVEGEWCIVDGDAVELHNTNRAMLFLPADAGWPRGSGRQKADLLAEFLPSAHPVSMWFRDAKEVHERKFDVVLALANQQGVREQLAHRNATVLLHATTGRNWLSQLHRHVAGVDDCIDCRLGEVKDVAFTCSAAQILTESEDRVDAALPFLSGASGLMLGTLLQRLQEGVLTQSSANNWRWDFYSDHVMAARPGRSTCRTGCASLYPYTVRAKANAGTAWAHLDGAVGARSPGDACRSALTLDPFPCR